MSTNASLFSRITGNTGGNAGNVENAGNTIDKKKNERMGIETDKNGDNSKPRGIEWGNFAKSVGFGALHLLIYMYIASSVIYSIRYLGTSEFFPENPNAPPYVSGTTIINGKRVMKNVGFPYGFYDKSNPTSLKNYAVNIIKYSWTTERSVIKSILNSLNEGFNLLDHYDFGTMDPANIERIKKIGNKVISYIYILLSPYLILPGLVFLSGLVGYIAMTIAWVTKAPDLFMKLFALATLLLFIFFISPFLSAMNIIQGIYTLVILAFMPLLKDYKHLFKFFGEYGGFISLLFILMVIHSSNKYLSSEITIGIIVGILFIYGGTIIHFLFGSTKK